MTITATSQALLGQGENPEDYLIRALPSGGSLVFNKKRLQDSPDTILLAALMESTPDVDKDRARQMIEDIFYSLKQEQQDKFCEGFIKLDQEGLKKIVENKLLPKSILEIIQKMTEPNRNHEADEAYAKLLHDYTTTVNKMQEKFIKGAYPDLPAEQQDSMHKLGNVIIFAYRNGIFASVLCDEFCASYEKQVEILQPLKGEKLKGVKADLERFDALTTFTEEERRDIYAALDHHLRLDRLENLPSVKEIYRNEIQAFLKNKKPVETVPAVIGAAPELDSSSPRNLTRGRVRDYAPPSPFTAFAGASPAQPASGLPTSPLKTALNLLPLPGTNTNPSPVLRSETLLQNLIPKGGSAQNNFVRLLPSGTALILNQDLLNEKPDQALFSILSIEIDEGDKARAKEIFEEIFNTLTPEQLDSFYKSLIAHPKIKKLLLNDLIPQFVFEGAAKIVNSSVSEQDTATYDRLFEEYVTDVNHLTEKLNQGFYPGIYADRDNSTKMLGKLIIFGYEHGIGVQTGCEDLYAGYKKFADNLESMTPAEVKKYKSEVRSKDALHSFNKEERNSLFAALDKYEWLEKFMELRSIPKIFRDEMHIFLKNKKTVESVPAVTGSVAPEQDTEVENADLSPEEILFKNLEIELSNLSKIIAKTTDPSLQNKYGIEFLKKSIEMILLDQKMLSRITPYTDNFFSRLIDLPSSHPEAKDYEAVPAKAAWTAMNDQVLSDLNKTQFKELLTALAANNNVELLADKDISRLSSKFRQQVREFVAQQKEEQQKKNALFSEFLDKNLSPEDVIAVIQGFRKKNEALVASDKTNKRSWQTKRFLKASEQILIGISIHGYKAGVDTPIESKAIYTYFQDMHTAAASAQLAHQHDIETLRQATYNNLHAVTGLSPDQMVILFKSVARYHDISLFGDEKRSFFPANMREAVRKAMEVGNITAPVLSKEEEILARLESQYKALSEKFVTTSDEEKKIPNLSMDKKLASYDASIVHMTEGSKLLAEIIWRGHSLGKDMQDLATLFYDYLTTSFKNEDGSFYDPPNSSVKKDNRDMADASLGKLHRKQLWTVISLMGIENDIDFLANNEYGILSTKLRREVREIIADRDRKEKIETREYSNFLDKIPTKEEAEEDVIRLRAEFDVLRARGPSNAKDRSAKQRYVRPLDRKIIAIIIRGYQAGIDTKQEAAMFYVGLDMKQIRSELPIEHLKEGFLRADLTVLSLTGEQMRKLFRAMVQYHDLDSLIDPHKSPLPLNMIEAMKRAIEELRNPVIVQELPPSEPQEAHAGQEQITDGDIPVKTDISESEKSLRPEDAQPDTVIVDETDNLTPPPIVEKIEDSAETVPIDAPGDETTTAETEGAPETTDIDDKVHTPQIDVIKVANLLPEGATEVFGIISHGKSGDDSGEQRPPQSRLQWILDFLQKDGFSKRDIVLYQEKFLGAGAKDRTHLIIEAMNDEYCFQIALCVKLTNGFEKNIADQEWEKILSDVGFATYVIREPADWQKEKLQISDLKKRRDVFQTSCYSEDQFIRSLRKYGYTPLTGENGLRVQLKQQHGWGGVETKFHVLLTIRDFYDETGQMYRNADDSVIEHGPLAGKTTPRRLYEAVYRDRVHKLTGIRSKKDLLEEALTNADLPPRVAKEFQEPEPKKIFDAKQVFWDAVHHVKDYGEFPIYADLDEPLAGQEVIGMEDVIQGEVSDIQTKRDFLKASGVALPSNDNGLAPMPMAVINQLVKVANMMVPSVS